jgi:hypothetical protein
MPRLRAIVCESKRVDPDSDDGHDVPGERTYPAVHPGNRL